MSDFSLANLVPNFPGFFSGTASADESITCLFVILLVIILVWFSVWAVREYFRSSRRISIFRETINGVNSEDLISKRRDLANSIKSADEGCWKLWREFDESLVESGGALKNTLDAEHFFSTFSLSRGLTENRLLAAVPGFLTAVGVIGTFTGLSLGLSGLETEGSTEQLKAGISSVISGASIAFMTSVWGVFLSVLFNFGEKLLERGVRRSIAELQNEIDFLFPRITAEQSLVQIVSYNKNTDEAIQEMAEKIGNKMQETMVEVSNNISNGLQTALNEALAPAIEKLVQNANGGAQQALDGLMERFLDKMGNAGESQKNMMEKASEDVSHAMSGLSSEISGFVTQVKQQNTDLSTTLQSQFDQADVREKERNENHSQQLNEMANRSQNLLDQLGSSLTDQFSSHQQTMNTQNEQADVREKERNESHSQQLNEMASRSQNLLDQLGSSLTGQFTSHQQTMDTQNEVFKASLGGLQENQTKLTDKVTSLLSDQQQQAEAIMNGFSTLESKLNVMADANASAAASLNQASGELKTSTNQLGLMAANVKEASTALGEMNTGASQVLETIVNEHQQLVSNVDAISVRIESVQSQMLVVTEDLISATTLAESGFKAVDQNMNKFINDMSDQVVRLDSQTADLMADFAGRVSDQTRHRMDEWNKNTSEFTTSMRNAIQSISNVVDEIDGKMSVAR